MRAHNFLFLFKQGTKNVLSNKLMSFASIGVLIACFLLIGAAVLFTIDVNEVAAYIGDQNEVVVYLDERLSDNDIDVVDLEIRGISNILEIKYSSKEDNLARLAEKLGEDPAVLLNNPDADNPLFASYQLRLADPAIFEDTIKTLSGIDGVYKVEGSSEVANTLVAIQQAVLWAGIGIVAILVVVSVVIITNTIKLTVFSRRKEINIMKYVGATDTFIRLPFLVEGMLIGLLAAAIAFFILGFGYTYLMNWLAENYMNDFILGFFLANAIEFRDIALYMFGGFAALGCLLGVIASGFFVRKYLRV
jgi:cell division transport system permease protein